ncbi:MAG: DNA polymerase-3 subunit delta [Desulforhopalus sp.]|jgi:DNA polymerase-3 subunit delta
MTLIKRAEFETALQDNGPLPQSQVYLFFGERYLCHTAADKLQERFLNDSPGALHNVDGDQEDPNQTLARLMSYSLLPGRQIYRVGDSRIFHSKTVISKIWDKAAQSHQNGRYDPAKKYLHAMIQAVGLKIDGPEPLSQIPGPEWKKVFAFDKPGEDLSWADSALFQSRDEVKTTGASTVDQYIAALGKGFPAGNILILTAETVDKRQRLFTHLKKNDTIVDCSVAEGASTAAQGEQKQVLKEMMLHTVETFNKKIDPRAVDAFFERVGFHPVAVATETEKLVHYVGDRPTITLEDLATMVGRSREDALYELTDAFSKRQLGKSLVLLSRLQEQGVHGLAILSTMRNFLRKLLIFRSLQMASSPIWHRGMNAKEFQTNYLPALKAAGEWDDVLGGHPYALFMSFTKAAEYSCPMLKKWLSMLLAAEFKLKGSPLPPKLVLEELFISMIKGSPRLPI